MYYMYTLQQ